MREGRIGRAEGVSAAWMSMMMSGIFSVNTIATYSYGNASYITTLLSAGFALLSFMLIAAAMRRRNCADLYSLIEESIGSKFGAVFSLVLVVSLVFAAVFPTLRMFIIMHRYIYAEANIASISVYFLPAIALIACLGLETIGRTMRVFIGLIVISFFVAMLISTNSLEFYRLFPIIGNGMKALFPLSITGMSRFLPGLICLTICGRGLQSVDDIVRSGRTALIFAAGITVLTQLCLGMAFDYTELAVMHSPMYRLLMSVEGGSPYARADKLLLFLWTLSSLLTSAFYVYAASLLYARATKMRDIRPCAICFSVFVASLVLFGQMNLAPFEALATFLWKNFYIMFLTPLAIVSIMSMCKRKRQAC